MSTTVTHRGRNRPLAALVTAALAAALVLVPGTPSRAAGTTFHVATDGTDGPATPPSGTCNGGTEAAPFRTIEYGMRCLRPGDTLVVHGGTYTEEVTPVTVSGTADAPILVRNAPGERVVVAGILWLRSAPSDPTPTGFDFWTIQGINVTYAAGISDKQAWLVKFVGGRNWTYQDAEVWNAGDPNYAAVRVEDLDGGPAGEPADWTLRRLCVHTTRTVHPPYQDHNIYIDTGLDAGSGLIERSVAFGAPNGKNLKLGPEAANVTVRYNTFYDASENLLVDGTSRNIRIERNLLGKVTGDKDWYPNIRGINHSGPNVVAQENGGFAAQPKGGIIFNSPESSTGILDGGLNVYPTDTAFDSHTCGGFVPTRADAMPFGHLSKLDRRFGTSRVATSVVLSQAAFPQPALVDTVLIARSDQYPDALAGAPLATQTGAPILLTDRTTLSPETEAEVKRLGPTTAYLLGGPTALDPAIEDELEALGVSDVRRLEGDNRFETAGETAREVGGTEVFVVEGQNADAGRGWPDAVSVSSLAAMLGRPILLVTTDALPDATRQTLIDLGVTKATIVGGTGAVSQAVADAVADPDDDGSAQVAVDRIEGPNRFATSTEVADAAVAAGADPANVWLASGLNWPDALAAGPVVAALGGVFVLVHPADLDGSAATGSWLADNAGSIDLLTIVGGAAAVASGVGGQVAATLG